MAYLNPVASNADVRYESYRIYEEFVDKNGLEFGFEMSNDAELREKGDGPLRFAGVQRLYGDEAFAKIASAHIMVVGLGGVGSWAAESLVRSGVGAITLVDYDDICISNTNRQVHAMEENYGKQKAHVLKDRFLTINPQCKIEIVEEMVTQESVSEILKEKYSCVVDCIDQGHNKMYLIAECRYKKLPVVTTGGAGGIKDPSKIKVSDLSKTSNDGMLANVRKWLRRRFEFPREGRSFHIPSIYSTEERQFSDGSGGLTFDRPVDTESAMDCATGFGTSVSITGTFGFLAASEALKIITKA